MALDDLAAQLDAAAAELAGAPAVLGLLDAAGAGFGAGGPGAAGALGLAMAGCWSAAVAARQREVAEPAARLADAAAAVRATAQRYREADRSAADQLRGLEA